MVSNEKNFETVGVFFVPVQLFFLILCGIAIILGIMDKDPFEHVILGPIILFCIGVSIQVFIVDVKHPYSKMLDVMISDFLKIDRQYSGANAERISLLFFITIFLVSSLSAIFILGNRIIMVYPLFAIFAFISSIALGLIAGRIFLILTMWFAPNKGKDFLALPEMTRMLEHNQFINQLLSTNHGVRISTTHSKYIQEQREDFISYVNDSRLFNELSAVDTTRNNTRFQKQVLSFVAPAKTAWFRDIEYHITELDAGIKEKIVDRLYSLLLHPVYSEILRKTIGDEKSNDMLISNLFDGLSHCMAVLNFHEFYFPEQIEDTALYPVKLDSDEIRFIRDLSVCTSRIGMIDWDPWWLLNLRPKISMLRHPNSNDEELGFKLRDSANPLFLAFAYCLKKFDDEGQIKSSKTDSEELIKGVFKVMGLNEYDDQIYLFRQLKDNSPEHDSLYLQFTTWAWLLFRLINQNEYSMFSDFDFLDSPINSDAVNTNYLDLTVPKLKKLNKERGLIQSGRKNELIQRLVDSDISG